MVTFHVKAALPEFAGRDINDLPAVSDVHRFSVLSVELSKFFGAKFFDGPLPPFPNAGLWLQPKTVEGSNA